MKVKTGRPLNVLVDEHVAMWRQRRTEQKKKAMHPGFCITISREPGSGGSAVARRLAADLGMDLLGAKIIQAVSEQASISAIVVDSLDKMETKVMDSWLDSIFQTRKISPDTYLRQLTRVVGTIGKHGNAIIVGRGAHYILPPPEAFRVRLIAPRETRIRNAMRDSKTDFEASESYVSKTETERQTFHQKYFHEDWANANHYDLVVNTGSMGVEGAVACIEAAFAVWKKRPRQ